MAAAGRRPRTGSRAGRATMAETVRQRHGHVRDAKYQLRGNERHATVGKGHGCAPASPGGTCPAATGPGRRSTSGSRAGRPTGPGPGSRRPCAPKPMPLASWTGIGRSTPLWSEPTDPGKTPASAGTVTRWADHQAAHHLRRAWPQPGHQAHPGSGRRHPPTDRAGGRRAGGAAWRAWPASHAGGAPDRRQGLLQPCQPPGLARPPPPHTIPERDDQKANRVRKGARGGRRCSIGAATSSATRSSG